MTASQGHRWWQGALPVVAAIVIALALCAAAVMLAVGGGDGTEPGAPLAAVPSVTPVPSATPAAAGGEAGASLAEMSRATIRAKGAGVLRRFHQHLVDGDLNAAWKMLTQRKRAQYLREDGYDGWAANQRTLGSYLDPSGARVAIEDIEERSGVVTVRVSGMSWSMPGSPCPEWGGITWVRYRRGEWRYEPGYSTTLGRRTEWEPRRTETLGWNCLA
jgi:hypothetical protein